MVASKTASMRPSSTICVLLAAGVIDTSCGMWVRKVQESASCARLPARSVTAADTSTVYPEPGASPSSGVTVTDCEALSYEVLTGARMPPRRSEKLASTTVASSRGSENPMTMAAAEPASTSACWGAGDRDTIEGRIASTVKAPTASKGVRRLPLPSMAPRTEIVASPEGVPSATVNSPLQVSPVNCRAENSTISPPKSAVTEGATAGSTPEWASAISRARLTVCPRPTCVWLRTKLDLDTSGGTVSMMKVCSVAKAEPVKPASIVCTDQK